MGLERRAKAYLATLVSLLEGIQKYWHGRQVFATTAALSASSLAAQFMFFLTISILSRIYGQKELGIFFLAYSLHAIGTPFFTLRLDTLIIHEQNKRIANSMLAFVTGFNVVLALVLLTAFFVACNASPIVLIKNLSLNIILLSVLCSSIASIYLTHCSFLSRQSDYRAQAFSRLLGPVVFLVLIIVSPFKTGIAIISAFAISLLVQNLLLCTSGSLKPFGRVYQFLFRPPSKIILKRIKYSLVALVPSSFLDMASQQLPVYIITLKLGLTPLAYYSVGQRIVMFPVSIIAPNIVSTYVPKLLESNAKLKLFKALTCKLIYFAIASYGLIYCLAPWLVRVILGSSSQQSVNVLRALIIAGIAMISSSLVSPTLLNLRIYKAPLICGFSAFLYRPIAFVLGLQLSNNLTLACVFYSVAESAQILITSIYTCNKLFSESQKK